MDWLAFEHLVLAIIEHEGFVARKTCAGPDGGVDIEMYLPGRGDQVHPYALVQCKARFNKLVGVDKARELYGIMASREVNRGYLISNSGFSPEAHSFARNSPGLGLCDLDWLISSLKEIPPDLLAQWVAKFFRDDFDVPSCPVCEKKMVRRDGTRSEFWGCRNFPRCRQTIAMRTSSRTH
jgi:restriction system protein